MPGEDVPFMHIPHEPSQVFWACLYTDVDGVWLQFIGIALRGQLIAGVMARLVVMLVVVHATWGKAKSLHDDTALLRHLEASP